MSQQHSDEVPITFLDVAACFSDDEWKLLNNWQKELYKNVMKEIHQAVISLGPLIATSIFSLRRKEKEDLCQVDHQESKIRGSMISSPIHHMSMEQELEPSLINPYGEEGGEISTGPGLGYMDTAPAASFAIKEERETYSTEHIDSERRESFTSTTGFPFHSSSVKASLRDCYGSEREESSICLNSGPKVTTPVASIGINEEGETYPIDIQLYGIRESISNPAGEGTTKRTCKDGDSVKYAKKAFPCKVSSGKTKAKVIQKSETKSHSRSQLWSESNWKLGGGKAIECKSGFRNDVHASLHQGSPKVRRSDKDNECESTLWKAQAFIGQTNTQQSWGSDTFPECEKSFRKNVNFVEHQRSQAESSVEVNYFQCIECDKHFSQKEYLISHQRTHSREKPYHCTECEKSFSHKHHLIGHQRTHSGERPFQCTKCAKSFSWKDSLRRHQRTHTGEKPYLCTKCDISFSWKESLVKHQREHTRLGLPQD